MMLAACTVPDAGPLIGSDDLSRTDIEAAAQDSRMDAPPPLPAPGPADFVLVGEEQLDHEVKLLNLSCSVGTFQSLLAAPVKAYLRAADRDGSLQPAPDARVLDIVDVRTLARSYSTATFASEARFDIELDLILTNPGSVPRPVAIRRTLLAAAGMTNCSSIARGLSVANLHIAAEIAGLASE
jgi:hypothetical protein